MKSFQNQELLSALKGANSLFLCTHIMPDGDAIGSMLAAGLILEKLGKRVALSCADEVPARYRFLPGADRIVPPDGLDPASFDAALSLDAADGDRVGACAGICRQIPLTLQVDHHGTNPLYAALNEVDASAPAVGVIVARMAQSLSVPLEDAVGRIGAEFLVPYPPGIPLLVPGERIGGELPEEARQKLGHQFLRPQRHGRGSLRRAGKRG